MASERTTKRVLAKPAVANPSATVTSSVENKLTKATVLPEVVKDVSSEGPNLKQGSLVPSEVEIALGVTMNMGNYEAARIDVRIKQPCANDQVDATYETLKEWAEKRIKDEVVEIRKALRGRGE